MTFKEQIAYRAKAFIAAAGVILVGLTEWVVQNPQTAVEIQKYLPAPWTQFVPIVLGAISAVLVHQIPNSAPITPAAAIEQLDTTAVRVITATNSGEFTGTPAH